MYLHTYYVIFAMEPNTEVKSTENLTFFLMVDS
jgi:hypothetical protein